MRTNKDSSVGEFDESIISVLNIIFESTLFRFDFVLFNIISFYNYFTSIASYLISGTNILKIQSWSKRKRI